MSIETILSAILVVMFMGAAFCGWALIINERAYRQRRMMADWIFSQPDWERRLAAYKTVSYDSHFWAIITLQNPIKLYPREAVE